MTLFGWDASDFDWPRGPMDLAAAKRDGISVFTHKATEGTSTKHTHYGAALNRAKSAGIPYLGAYLVARSGNVAAEVNYFLNYVNAQTPWWEDCPGWFWQIDLEKWPYDSVSASTGAAVADTLAARTGKPTLIYASRGQYANGLAGTDHQLWNAAYGNNPAKHFREAYPGDSGSGWTAYSGRTPLIWQYGSKTTIGSQSTCDANAIRDEAAWHALFGDDDDMTQDEFNGLMKGFLTGPSAYWLGAAFRDTSLYATDGHAGNFGQLFKALRTVVGGSGSDAGNDASWSLGDAKAALTDLASKVASPVDPATVTAAVQSAAGPAIQAAVAPAVQAAVAAALADPAVLAAIAAAVNEDESKRLAG